jgi:hypothetical protein
MLQQVRHTVYFFLSRNVLERTLRIAPVMSVGVTSVVTCIQTDEQKDR